MYYSDPRCLPIRVATTPRSIRKENAASRRLTKNHRHRFVKQLHDESKSNKDATAFLSTSLDFSANKGRADNNKDSPSAAEPKRAAQQQHVPWVSYEMAVWFVFVTITALAIIARFTSNVWPQQTYSIRSGSAGSDRLSGYKPGPWSIKAYEVMERICGRFCLFGFIQLAPRDAAQEYGGIFYSFLYWPILVGLPRYGGCKHSFA